MGRVKKYHTPEEKKRAQCVWTQKYYQKNKEIIDEKARRKYYNRKTQSPE